MSFVFQKMPSMPPIGIFMRSIEVLLNVEVFVQNIMGSLEDQKNVSMLSKEIRLLSMPSRSVSMSMASPRS
jgi:hypothetical protein